MNSKIVQTDAAIQQKCNVNYCFHEELSEAKEDLRLVSALVRSFERVLENYKTARAQLEERVALLEDREPRLVLEEYVHCATCDRPMLPVGEGATYLFSSINPAMDKPICRACWGLMKDPLLARYIKEELNNTVLFPL